MLAFPHDYIAFPNFFSFLLSEIPNSRMDINIMKSLVFAAFGKDVLFNLNETICQANQAVLFGFPPVIVPRFKSSLNDTAEFKPLEKQIEINMELIAKFEKDHTNKKARQFMLATILHEIVHYLDYLDGEMQDYEVIGGKTKLRKWAKDKGTDQGHIFEEMAFVTPPRPWWL